MRVSGEEGSGRAMYWMQGDARHRGDFFLGEVIIQKWSKGVKAAVKVSCIRIYGVQYCGVLSSANSAAQ